MAIRELTCISCPLGCPLKVETDEESQEEILATVEDEDVLDAVFERFSQRLEDYFDGSDELTEEEELRREGY